jgi:hypothetical protein
VSHSRANRPREIVESICTEAGCQFNGDYAQQGVCYADEGSVADWSKLDKLERELEGDLELVRKSMQPEEYTAWLEAQYVCIHMNWDMTLDECVRLRRDNALLRRAKP